MIIEFFVGFAILVFFLAVVATTIAAATYLVGPAICSCMIYGPPTRKDMKWGDWFFAFIMVACIFLVVVILGGASVELGRNILEVKYGD